MTDLPTPARRAELYRHTGEAIVGHYAAMIDGHELRALLDATKPVGDGEAARTEWVLSGLATDEEDASRDANAVFLRAAASLVYRQAREIAALQEATTWRGIESAPTEDIFFLIAGAGRVFVTRGSIFMAARKTNVPEHLSLRWVTRWAPLPSPPKEPTP